MRLIPIFTAAAVLALSAGVASAQSTGSGDMNQAGTTSDNSQAAQPMAQPATQAAAPAAATGSMSTAGLPPIDTAKAGDPNVITNGPIPDTPENRAKYGQPMSNAGRHTKPAGN